nr:Chain C, NP peptide from influenza, YFSPIRVTF [Influenza B virus]
YFSPIRVTF